MPTTKPVTKRYYPALSEMITVDDLPEFLHFAETGLNSLLNRIHYKNFQFSKSARGDSAFYSLDIVTNNIGLDLPFGLRFVLNPAEDDSTISGFPISLQYQWEVLAFLRSFNIQNFAFTADAFFDLGLKIFRISQEQVIAQVLNYFVDNEDGTDAKFQDLIDAINLVYADADLALPAGEEPTVEMVAAMINESPAIPENVAQVMFGIYIFKEEDGGADGIAERLEQFYALMVPDGIQNYIKKLLEPKIRATLKLSAAIEFPPNVLRPITPAGVPISNTYSRFKFGEATFYADTEAGIGANIDMEGSMVPAYPAVLHEIGHTGLTINFTEAKLDLSRKTNIPEADAAGYPVDFMGIYAKQVVVGFHRFGVDTPGKPSAQITAENLFIGTGGVSGKLALEANGFLYRDFGSFSAELNLFALEFRMGSIVSSDIKGTISIDRFKQGNAPAVIDIQAHIRDNGNFDITATSQDIAPIKFGSVFEIKIKSLAFGKEERGYYAQVAGTLDFLVNIPVLGDILPKGIEIRKLRIWEDGDLEFEGGGLTLPKSFHLKIGPVNLEVTNIGTSGYRKQHNGIERKYRYFSFDGMLNTGRAGINTTGNGIKFYFTIDDDENKPFHCFLSIDKITIDMTVPGNVDKDDAIFILNGSLTMSNPDPAVIGTTAASEYGGAISFAMPRLRMAGSAGMRLNPSTPAFIVDIGLELSTPVPLGATGLGIYGFRGLIGQHYMPSKTAAGLPESASWWDYYKAKKPKEGVTIDKFANEPGFSVGAGASIATSFDSGRVFSSKLFLLLGLPDIFLLQGQAGVLRSRIGLDDTADPPFSALIIIEKSSFLANLGVNYRLPEGGSFDGALFSVSGNMELAFYFNNASGWHIYLGKDQPETARIRARVLTLFQGYAYLMISSRGFKAGAGARFDFKKKFGPAAVGIGAWIDLGGSISFKPIQIGAFIQLGGYAYISVFGAKLNISVQIGLAVEAPHPFIIQGSLMIKVKIIFIKIKINIELTWRINNDNSPLLAQQPVLQLPGATPGYIPVTATNILSGDVFTVNYLNHELADGSLPPAPGDAGWNVNFLDIEAAKLVTVPLDSFIDIDLQKSVRPMAQNIGGVGNQLPDGYVEMIPPQKGLSNQVKHQFEFTGLEIYSYDEGTNSWKPYHIYEAVTAIVEENIGSGAIDLNTLKSGYWQFAQPNRYNKIRVMSQNMFSFTNQTTNAISDLDGLNFRRKDLFCFENVSKQGLINWANEATGTTYADQSTFLNKTFSFTLQSVEGTVEFDSLYSENSLSLSTKGGKLVIDLPEPLSFVKIDFGDNSNNIRVDFVKITYVAKPVATLNSRFIRTVRVEHYLTPIFISSETDHSSVTYSDMANAIDRIEINFLNNGALDFNGDLILGGYFQLPNAYAVSSKIPFGHEEENYKSLMFASFYTKAFTLQEVINKSYKDATGAVAQWSLQNVTESINGHHGVLLGSPDMQGGYFEKNGSAEEELHQVLQYISNDDSVLVPFETDLKVETGDFAFELMVVFNPFVAGISTLLSKVETDTLTGNKKGYTLHLVQDTPPYSYTDYGTMAALPSFSVYFTCYDGTSDIGIKATEKYTIDCETGYVIEKQYKHVLVSVKRETNELLIFIDRILKVNIAVPTALDLFQEEVKTTVLNQLSYLTEELQRLQEENETSKENLIEEVQLLSDGLSRTIQPIWRPNTTFAIAIKTRDVVNSTNTPNRVQVFGFKTAGPIGHFQQQSSVYQKLEAQDRTGEFKLANLKYYIDYERSFPDAQSRYDLSKPVFCVDPQIKLLFIKPYINAMYENWDAYQGLPSIQSSLELQLVDTFATTFSPQLVWEQLPDKPITLANFQSLTVDQQILFLMNMAASADNCNESPLVVKKRSKQGAYQLPNLDPNKLYTAIFNAKYQPFGTDAELFEVHRYNFITSRFENFDQQAKSFILNETEGEEEFAIYPIRVAFTADEIEQNLKVLLDEDLNNDPEAVQRYAVKYDRVVYGGLKLKNLDEFEHTIINVIVNTDPATNEQQILGMLIRNPEPFNDPKIPLDLLQDTIGLELKLANNTVIGREDFIYIHSRNTAAVFVSNMAMSMASGMAKLHFRYKVFNGEDYQTEHEDYISPSFGFGIDI
ncbi:hypothetical protein [Pedobacter frigiditerrae]|uniref:hypothetical protein n=1 Tax=Pedobacter frigiditerrae TaxID=2530452 RepID=UPI00292D127F|nr:hypothetical protein [Pedobacter frigiditerrae]